MPTPPPRCELLARLRGACGERISAFEIISRLCLDLVLKHIPGTREPLPEPHPWYVLIELADTERGRLLRGDFERAVERAVEDGLVRDAVDRGKHGAVAGAVAHARDDTRRPRATRACSTATTSRSPVSRIPDFIAAAGAALEHAFPGARVICFGHLGDGNLHYNCFVPGRNRDDAAARDGDRRQPGRARHRAATYGGSFSAEHGIGQAKRANLRITRARWNSR